jgi:hypothetical protein
MVIIGMYPRSLRDIGKKACLRTTNLFRLQKDLGSKRRPNIWRRKEWKESRESMKVEEEVCIVIDIMVIAWNNELKFQKLLKHHPI